MKFAHATINVKDMDESLRFYQDIVGLPVAKRFEVGQSLEIAFLGEGQTLIELIFNKEDNKDINIGTDISLGFRVDSMEEQMDYVKSKGIEIHSGPFSPNPATRFFFVEDPNGLKIQFIEQK